MPSLDRDERNLKKLVQEILIKNGVLRTRTEREWDVYATKRILRDFVTLFQERKKEEEAASKKKPAASPRSPGSDRRGTSHTPAASPPGKSSRGRSAGKRA